ncbi:MAG: dockerin type I domain-containing protein, partial [Planctomycetota bacterium]
VNLGHPGVQAKLAEYCTELATNYPTMWGIHTDYHRFPLDNDTGDSQLAPYSFDAWSRAQFQSEFGVDPLFEARLPFDPFYDEFVQWRRDGIAQAAGAMHDAIVAVDPGKQFSGAIFATAIADRFGNPNSGQLVKMQDWPQMAANGWLPVVIPMAYGSSTLSIRNDLQAAIVQKGPARIVAGLAIINPNNRPGVTAQLNTLYAEGLDSFVFFEAGALTSTQSQIDELANYVRANGPWMDADFDQDGLIDGQDWDHLDAEYASAPRAHAGPEDLDNNGFLNENDRAIFFDRIRQFRFGEDARFDQADYQTLLGSFTSAGENWPRHLFDVTGDGAVDCADVSRLRLVLSGVIDPTVNADISGDGAYNAPDVSQMESLVESGDALADVDGVAGVDVFDFLLYLSVSGSSCP